MSDLISRKDAVSRMSDLLMIELQGQRLPTWNEVYQAMNDIPSAEPERKKGEWIYDGKRGRFPACKCSICGHYENADWAILQGANFCPNCGADMRGDHE